MKHMDKAIEFICNLMIFPQRKTRAKQLLAIEDL